MLIGISPHGQTPLKFGKTHESLVTQKMRIMARYLLTLSAFKYFASVRGFNVFPVICMNPSSPSAFSFGSFRFFALLRSVKRLMPKSGKKVFQWFLPCGSAVRTNDRTIISYLRRGGQFFTKKTSKNSFFFLRATTQSSQPTSASSALSHHTVRLRRRTTRPRLHPRHRNRPDYLPTDPPDCHTPRECLPMVFSDRRCH